MRKRIRVIFPLAMLLLSARISLGQYALKEADREFVIYNYRHAIELYKRAYAQKESIHAAEGLAGSYRLTRNYPQAEIWYGKLAGMEHADPEHILYYAHALRNNSKYSEAKAQYERYGRLGKNVSEAELALWKSSCDSALQWMKNPKKVVIENRRELSSGHSDWGAVAYKDHVVFSSDTLWEPAGTSRPFLALDHRADVNTSIYGWTGNPYLRLYQKQGSEIKLFPLPGAGNYHTGAASFDGEGTEMYFTITRGMNKQERKKSRDSKLITLGVEIYSSKLENGKWSEPVPFRYNNMSEWSVGDPFITADGQRLYFISDKPGGHGGTDIYICDRDGNGAWGEAVNLGREINTAGNERSPFAVSENTLYFSSDGLPGMGGLDLFKAVRGSSGNYRVVNMAYPLNSPQDDFAFSFTSAAGGYFSSNRAGGEGSDDIFSFELKEQEPFVVEGLIADRRTGNPLEDVSITATDIKTGRLVSVKTDPSGRYRMELDSTATYELSMTKANYAGISGITVRAADRDSWAALTRGLSLEPALLHVTVRLEKIYYDFDQWGLRPESRAELDKLVKLLKDSPALRVDISSHTDSRGKRGYNQELSQRRAETVANYLKSQGIEAGRLAASGYGESSLLSGCTDGITCTEADHQRDRRTEFMVVEK